MTTLALHGVALAPISDGDFAKLETSQAKEIVFTFLMLGHRICPVMHVHYACIIWLAQVVQCPGVTQVFVQAIWERKPQSLVDGPVGPALRTMLHSLGWYPRDS